jgi:CDP-glucose 4,6-dehydratase
MSFNEVYSGKRVLVTGHTGFKGSWLTMWLLSLGAEVCGISMDIPTAPSLFEMAGLEREIEHHIADVRDLDALALIINSFRPDFVFHLAAQAIVSRSYQDPVNTVTTNVIGMACMLDVLRRCKWPCIAILVTSDKAYENVEWLWGYRETDRIGGRDIYSASKGCAELIIHAYYHSFFRDKGSTVRIGVTRAGNVIGGGDWALDRIVVDCMRAWSDGGIVTIRNPTATRPWQHVLEPLSGYLWLGRVLLNRSALDGEAFNFGPRTEQGRTVIEVVQALGRQWGFSNDAKIYQVVDNAPFNEAGLLNLNCDKALFHLKWEPTLSHEECIRFTGGWYRSVLKEGGDARVLTMAQLDEYQGLASHRQRIWCKGTL